MTTLSRGWLLFAACQAPAAPVFSLWACPQAWCDVYLVWEQSAIEDCHGDAANLPSSLSVCAEDWGEAVCAFRIEGVLLGDNAKSPVIALTREDAATICAETPDWGPAEADGGPDALERFLDGLQAGCALEPEELWLGECRVPLEFQVVQIGPA